MTESRVPSDVQLWTAGEHLLDACWVPLGLAPLLNEQRTDTLREVSLACAAVVYHAEFHLEALLKRLSGTLPDFPQGHCLR